MDHAAKHLSRKARIRAVVDALLDVIADDDSAGRVVSRWMRAAESPVDGRTVRAWIRAGELPSCRPGKFLLVDRDVHDRLCVEHTKSPPQSGAANDVDDLDEDILSKKVRR